ncbi:MAG TPA: hypothetical protein IAA58_11290 [Candidatus Gallacutalibacter stercoravium]|nr:hypothetical protein [Candidatus Gallacutalibacter stercoravium]
MNEQFRGEYPAGVMCRPRPLRACLSIFRIKLLESLQYRLAAFTGAATGVFWALIEITVYIVFFTYAENASVPFISNGLTLPQVISYSWLGQVLFGLQVTAIEGDILEKITNGDVGLELCRPLNLFGQWYARTGASHLSTVLLRGGMTLIAGLLMPEPYRLSAPVSWAGFLCFLCSITSAFLLCTAFGTFASVIRLNIAWGNGPMYIMLLLGSVLSGNYLPLQLWPQALQPFLLVQPFAGYLDIPLRLYLGTMPTSQAFAAIALQLIWTAVFVLAGVLLLKRRLADIVVQGG